MALSNLWLFGPLVQAQLEKGASTNAMLRTTTALTIVKAGNKDNVMPGQAEATVNFRLLPGDTLASVMQHVQAARPATRFELIGAARQLPSRRRCRRPQSASYQLINRTVRSLFPDAVVAPGLMIAATDSRHFDARQRPHLPLLAGARQARGPAALPRHQRTHRHRQPRPSWCASITSCCATCSAPAP